MANSKKHVGICEVCAFLQKMSLRPCLLSAFITAGETSCRRGDHVVGKRCTRGREMPEDWLKDCCNGTGAKREIQNLRGKRRDELQGSPQELQVLG